MGFCGRGCLLVTVLVVVLGSPLWAYAVKEAFYGLVTDAIFEQCHGAATASFDPDTTLPWAQEFRAGWREIRDELHAYERQAGYIPPLTDIEPTQVNQAPHKQWRSLWLQLYGRKSKLGAAHFPRTMAMLEKTTVVTAMFSILEPGRGLELHRGDFKGLWRYHVALEHPPPSAGETEASEPLFLAVATKPRYGRESPMFRKYFWAEGEHLLFDDTFWHKVENRRAKSGRKVVLFMDVPRRDCPAWLGGVLWYSTRYVIQLIPRIGRIISFADDAAERGEAALKGRGDTGSISREVAVLHGIPLKFAEGEAGRWPAASQEEVVANEVRGEDELRLRL